MLAEGFSEKFDLIYIDPPFFSGADYSVVEEKDGKKSISFAYKDTWGNDLKEYLRMITVSIFAMKELLSKEGLIWIHLDWHAVHYVKLIMDEIFSSKNFVNEVIWSYKSGGSSRKRFSRKHDTLLLYSKSGRYKFNPQKEKSYNRGFRKYSFKGVEEFEDEKGWYTMVNMKDVWNIDMVGRTSKERTGYATQKPEALMERIILSSSDAGSLCGDFFCGSGTFPAMCKKLGRQFICCDVGELAVKIAKSRVE